MLPWIKSYYKMYQRESLVYLGFLLRNIFLILIPAFLIGVLAFIYQSGESGIYHYTNFYEVNYSGDKLAEIALVTDEIVSVLRSPNFQSEVSLPHGSVVTAYKSGPFSLYVDISNKDQTLASNGLNSMEQTAIKKYPLQKIGETKIDVKKYSEYIFLVLGFFSGLSVGVVFSLIKYYFDNY